MATPDDSAPRTATIDLPPSATRDLSILILLADTPIPACVPASSQPHSPPLTTALRSVVAQFGDYHSIFAGLLRRAVRIAASEGGAEPAKEGGGHKLTVEGYDVVQGKYPSEERLKQADGVLITGSGASSPRLYLDCVAQQLRLTRYRASAASAYEDEPWILDLVSFVQRLPKVNAALKLVGICFGHQVIARAYGGVCERSEKGWEIGTRRIELTQRGKQLFEGHEKIVRRLCSRAPRTTLSRGSLVLVSRDLHPHPSTRRKSTRCTATTSPLSPRALSCSARRPTATCTAWCALPRAKTCLTRSTTSPS